MSLNLKPPMRIEPPSHNEDKLILSSDFAGLVDDPELSNFFDMVADLADHSFDRQMWEVTELLEKTLDALLKFKDRRDNGIVGFYSRRTTVIGQNSTRFQFNAELTRLALSSPHTKNGILLE